MVKLKVLFHRISRLGKDKGNDNRRKRFSVSIRQQLSRFKKGGQDRSETSCEISSIESSGSKVLPNTASIDHRSQSSHSSSHERVLLSGLMQNDDKTLGSEPEEETEKESKVLSSTTSVDQHSQFSNSSFQGKDLSMGPTRNDDQTLGSEPKEETEKESKFLRTREDPPTYDVRLETDSLDEFLDSSVSSTSSEMNGSEVLSMDKDRSKQNGDELHDEIESVVLMMESGTASRLSKFLKSKSSRKGVDEEDLRLLDKFIENCDGSSEISSLEGSEIQQKVSSSKKSLKEGRSGGIDVEASVSSNTTSASKEEDNDDGDNVDEDEEEGEEDKVPQAFDFAEYAATDEFGFPKPTEQASPAQLLPSKGAPSKDIKEELRIEKVQKALIESLPSGISTDSWGQTKFLNVHPIARLRYLRTRAGAESIPNYY